MMFVTPVIGESAAYHFISPLLTLAPMSSESAPGASGNAFFMASISSALVLVDAAFFSKTAR